MTYRLSDFCAYLKQQNRDLEFATLQDLYDSLETFKKGRYYGMQDLYDTLGPVIGFSARLNAVEEELSTRSTSISHLLKCAFKWAGTPQGHDFWAEIYNYLCNEGL